VVKLVETQDLSFAYPGPIVGVDGLDFVADAGELVAVLGPNGAGKSTLLKLLAGLLTPTSGSVRLGGTPLGELKSRERARRVAVVPQSLTALPDVTVETFVRYGRYAHQTFLARPSRSDHDAVERALIEADAADLAARPLAELSGGQRQRALVARALAQEAELLLIDEPTNALDPEHQVLVFELIAKLAREGRCAIVVTHELNLASQFATRIVLLDEGRGVADGDVAHVLSREVLEPVYGTNLRYGTFPAPGGDGERPFIVPWLNRSDE